MYIYNASTRIISFCIFEKCASKIIGKQQQPFSYGIKFCNSWNANHNHVHKTFNGCVFRYENKQPLTT